MNNKVEMAPINARYRELWLTYMAQLTAFYTSHSSPVLWPLQYQDTLHTGAVIYIGSNPATPKKPRIDSYSLAIDPNNAAEIFASQEQIDKVVEERLHALGRPNPSTTYSYYKPMHKLHGPSEWEHVDMLPIHYTKRHELQEFLAPRGNPTALADEMLEPFLRLMEMLRPRVIVIIDTWVRNLLFTGTIARRSGWTLSPSLYAVDSKTGYQSLTFSEGWTTPIFFFSSMLTGQRALDAGSTLRLQWHINQALNIMPAGPDSPKF